MKNNHSIPERGLSILLSLIIAMTTLLTVFPASAAAEESPPDTTGDIFDGIGFDKSLPDDQSDRANTLRPYGENAEMFTVNELYTLRYNGGRMEAMVYGHERQTRTEPEEFRPDIAGSTGGWYTSGITGSSRVEAMEGDFAGDGKPDQVALFVANPIGPLWKYTLGVSTAYNRRGGELPVTWIDISKDFTSLVSVEESDDLVNLMKIATGDINGDGRDEIVVLMPDETNDSVKVVAYSFDGAGWSSGSTLIRMPNSAGGIRLGMGIGNNESVAYSLAVGDIDGDGYDDVAVAASAVLYGGFNQPIKSDAACKVYMSRQGRTCDVPLTVKKDDDVRYSGFGVEIADADGDKSNELIVGAYQVEDQPGNSNYYDLQGFIGWFYQYDGGLSMTQQPGGLDAAQASESNWRPVEYSDRFVDAVSVTATEYDGIGAPPVVFMNFDEYRLDSSTGRFVARGIGSINLKDQSFQTRPATLEGGDSEHGNGLRNGLIVRYKKADGTWVLHQFYSTYEGYAKSRGIRLETAQPVPFALPDTDKDSVFLKYKAYTFGYTDPVVIAALASPPYYKDLQHLEDAGDYKLGSSTSYGQSKTTGGGTTESRTISVGAYINFEMQAGCKYAKAVLEAEANYNHGWTEQMDNIKTVTQSIEYTTLGGQDSVVLVTVPVDVFVYDMYAPADEKGTKYQVSDLRVVVPYEARSRTITAETYDTMREAYPGILPNISGEVFTHTIGYPSTYPKSPAGYENSMTGARVSVGEGDSTTTTEIAFEEEVTTITSQSNSIDGKAGGGGVGGDDAHFELKLTAGITGGYEQTAGQIKTTVTGSTYTGTVYGIPKSVGDNYRYTWQMLYYNYNGNTAAGPVNFPVVTYVVTEEKSPPFLPDPVWVEKATGDLGTEQLTIRWNPSPDDTTPSAGADNEVQYELYLQSDTGDRLINTPYTYNEAGGYYELIHKGLFPGRKYTYTILSKTGSGVIPAMTSVKSEAFSGYTLPDVSDAVFTTQPRDILVRPKVDGAVLTAKFDAGIINQPKEILYQWQIKTGDKDTDWEDLKDSPDSYSGANTPTLTLVTDAKKTHYGRDLEGEYRLLVGVQYNVFPDLIYFLSETAVADHQLFTTEIGEARFYVPTGTRIEVLVNMSMDPLLQSAEHLIWPEGSVTLTLQTPTGAVETVTDDSCYYDSENNGYQFYVDRNHPTMIGTYTITHISYSGSDIYKPTAADVSISYFNSLPLEVSKVSVSDITKEGATLNFTSSEAGMGTLTLEGGEYLLRDKPKFENLKVKAGKNSIPFSGLKYTDTEYTGKISVVSDETGREGSQSVTFTTAPFDESETFIRDIALYGNINNVAAKNYWTTVYGDNPEITLREDMKDENRFPLTGDPDGSCLRAADVPSGRYHLYANGENTGLIVDHTIRNKDEVFAQEGEHAVSVDFYSVNVSVVREYDLDVYDFFVSAYTQYDSEPYYILPKVIKNGDFILALNGPDLTSRLSIHMSAFGKVPDNVHYKWGGAGTEGATGDTLILDHIDQAVDITYTVSVGDLPLNHTATLYVNKDDAPWEGHGKTFTLKDVRNETKTAALSGAGGTLTAQVTNGTWAVYDGGTDTGERIIIQDGNGEAGLEYYTVQFGVKDAGDASGSTISATCNGEEIESDAVLPRGSSLVITASGAGASENGSYFYAWSGAGTDAQTDDTLTIRQLSKPVNAQCTVTGVNLDITPPTGTITLKSNGWIKFWNTVTFNLFFKETVDVEITAQDDRESTVKIEYYLSPEELSEQQAKAIVDWTEGSKFSIDPNHKYIVYARLTDEAGNMAIINSSGIVVYTDSASLTPSIEYVKASTQDVTARVILNGNTIDQVKNGENILTPGTDYTVEDNAITFHASYLDTLAAGETPYTLTISYRPMGESYVEGEENQKPADTSISLTVTKAEQDKLVITGLKSTYTYGDDAFDIGASGGSGTGAVTWQSSDESVASVDQAGKVTVHKPGKAVVTVTKAMDDSFIQAQASSTISVEKATLTVNAADAQKQYGEENPAFSYEMVGFVNGDTKEDLAALPVLTADADKTTGVGSYAIRLAGGADENYEYVLNKAELTITPRPITVKADDKEMTEGGELPKLTWTVTEGSLVDGDDLGGSLKAEATGAGKHSIMQDTPFTNPNYTVTFLPGELTVLAKQGDSSDPMPSEPTHPDIPQTGDEFPSWTLLLLLLSVGGIDLTFRSLRHRKVQ